MNRRRNALLASLMAALLLVGCAGKQNNNTPAPAEEDKPSVAEPEKTPEKESEPVPPPAEPEDDTAPEDTEPETLEAPPELPAEETPAAPPSQPQQEEPAPVEPPPAPAASVPEDGSYTASVTLEGGTGRASVESSARLRCEGGKFWATIVWSSPNFDYMKVDGQKYDQLNTEGNSTFEIPVAAFDQKLDVIADTVAMSEPHEVEYTLQFDSASLQKA